ncbi:SIS domain-containing protein [Jonesiaceae bacterium BS-20]|uniref:SIS domain-containing protein n=1 Tax=Jonesiaceae bacterium BS-20 TaxID=3120821 RepID=A0AAU7DTS7_9MICO
MSPTLPTTLQILAELKSVFERISPNQVQQLIKVIGTAPRIFVLGVGREGLAARGFAMRLMHLGFEVHWGWDETTPNVTDQDLFIQVNGSGAIGHLDYVFAQVRATGATTVVVTGVPTAETPMQADVVVSVPATVYRGSGDLVESIQPMGSLFEQSLQLLFDTVILELARLTGVTNEQLAARHRNFE